VERARACGVLRGALLGLALIACKHPSDENRAPVDAGHVQAEETRTVPLRSDVAISPIDDVAHSCVFGFEGTVLDFGDPDLESSFGPKLVTPPLEVIEREGASWARIRSKSLTVDFYVPPSVPDGPAADAGSPAYLEAHVRGGAAKVLAFYVNGKLVGRTPLAKDEARVVSFKAPSAEVAPGANQLLLMFSGAPKGSTDPVAEVDWVHLGRGEKSSKYPVFLRGDAKASATLLGNPQRVLALRAGSYVRCAGWIPVGSRFETTLGLSGPGSGDAEVRLIRDRAPPMTLGTAHVEGAEKDGKVVTIGVSDVGDKAGMVGALELRATRTTPGTRVLFGEPKLTVAASSVPERSTPARGVVLVVLSGVETASLSVYGGPRVTAELQRIAGRGIVFEAHRASTGLQSGSFASMLSGLSPRDHSVLDANARLPDSVTTVADAARQAGIATALFTATPTGGAAFGFDRGWSTFEEQGLFEATPAVHVLDRAGAWVSEHKTERFLVVVYARGGHPPWDISLDEQRSLAPDKYTGALDPKHAAELLAHPSGHGLSEDDRVRAWSMYDVALAAHDAALGRLVLAVDAAGRGGDTAIVVTGDVGLEPRVPLTPTGSLDEAVLWTPLVIGLPRGELGGSRVASPTTGLDLARTMLGILGLTSPDAFGGVDLVDLAAHRTSLIARPLMSMLGDRFALRWGSFVEMGQRDREGRLCDLTLEPTCISDVRESYPLTSAVLHAEAFDLLVTKKGSAPAREPTRLDKEAHDALRAWGL
jgi:arylsulfatase A-like enzyme